MQHCKRIGIVALLALVFGACTTLALTWALAEWRPLPNAPPMSGGQFMHWNDLWPWHVVQRHSPGISVTNWSRATADYVTAPRDGSIKSRLQHLIRLAGMTPQQVMDELQADNERLSRDRPGFVSVTEPPDWGTFAASEPPPSGQICGADAAFGWPMRCMWYQVQAQVGGNRVWGDQLRGGIARRGQPSAVMHQHRALPMMPMWSGLIGNTLIYAALWCALMVTVSITRRIVRERRGQCLACGYDLSGSVVSGCPECGSGRRIGQ